MKKYVLIGASLLTLVAVGAGCAAPDENHPTGNTPEDAQAVERAEDDAAVLDKLRSAQDHLMNVADLSATDSLSPDQLCGNLPEIKRHLKVAQADYASVKDEAETLASPQELTRLLDQAQTAFDEGTGLCTAYDTLNPY